MNQPLDLEGLNQALEAVALMAEQELLRHLDSLYGRDNLSEELDLDEIRAEANRQTKLNFRKPDAHIKNRFDDLLRDHTNTCQECTIRPLRFCELGGQLLSESIRESKRLHAAREKKK